MGRFRMLLLCISLILCLALPVSAEELTAEDISQETEITVSGFSSAGFLTDQNIDDYAASKSSASVTLKNQKGLGSLYLLFDYEYGGYTITDNQTGAQYVAGTDGFLHEFVDLVEAFGYAPASVTLAFQDGRVYLSEIYIFSQGEVPGFVQKWEKPVEDGADILMLPTHGDDDQLYFAGLLPLYAGELDLRVQVVYMTNHRNYTNVRYHEILNGLWGTGVENYPVFLTDLDFRVDSLEGSYRVFRNYKVTREDLLGRLVEQLRRFQPQVAVGHDVDGEYGHGMHLVYADLLMAAVEISNDPQAYPESAEKYGVWDVPKTYLHLWRENPIVLNYDVPLESYDGLTAFQVTQTYGFPCHVSQHVYPAFTKWLYGADRTLTKASEIEKYSPCEFGLYRTTVGLDVEKDDFMEHLVSYDQQILLAQQEQTRLEEEQKLQEQEALEKLEEEKNTQKETLAQETPLPTESAELEEEVQQEIQQAQTRYMLSVFALAALILTGFSLGSKWAKRKNDQHKGLSGEKKLKK